MLFEQRAIHDSDQESVYSFSSTIAHYGERRQDEVHRRMTNALEILSSFPMPIGHHNRIKAKKNQNQVCYEKYCAQAWNDTIQELDPVVRDIVSESKYEPDGVVGGCRYIKQEIEYLIIEKWVRLVMNVYIEEQKQKLQKKMHTSLGNECISQTHLDTMNTAWNEFYHLTTNAEETVLRIVENVRHIFLNDKIFVHTIKGRDTQSIPILKAFFDNPSIKAFETLAKYHWKYHIKQRREKRKKMCDKIDAAVVGNDQYDQELQVDIRCKRMNHTDMEKSRVKNKTFCKCVGLPLGFPRCVNYGVTLPYGLLIHEHRLPLAVFDDESDENRWGMCANCSKYKTRYIDKYINDNKDDTILVQNFKNEYTLPDDIINEILLSVEMDMARKSKST